MVDGDVADENERSDVSPRSAPKLVSVVVPARDAGETIGDQLAALGGQDYKGPWELVVVDNGSRDNTTEVVRRHIGAGFPVPARVVAAPGRAGAAHARNVGAARAAGDLIAFCDADDVVAVDWLRRLVDAARDVDAVGAGFSYDQLNDVRLLQALELGSARAADQAGASSRFGQVLSSGGLAIWRDVFERVGRFDETFVGGGEDKDLTYRLVRAGYQVEVDVTAVVHLRLRSTTRARMAQAFERGVQDPHLYRDHAAEGYPPRDVWVFLRTLAGLVRDLPLLLRAGGRAWWLMRASREAGRLWGSARYRTLHL